MPFILDCCAPAGADHHTVHRFPRADIQLVFRLSGREGLCRAGRPDGLPQLRGRAVVGRDHGDNDRLRRHGAADVDGQDRGVVLQRLCDIVFRTSSGK